MGYRLRRRERVADSARRVAGEQLERALAALDPAAAGGSLAEAVHQVRVCGKRVRALLRLVRPLLADGDYRRGNRAVRDAARRIGALRDSDVLLDCLDGFVRGCGEPLDADVVAAVRSRLERDRGERWAGAEPHQLLAAVADDLRAVQREVGRWRFDRGDADRAVAAGLAATHRRARRAMAAATAAADEDGHLHHAWRKQAKYAFFQHRLLRPTWPPVVKAWARQLDRLSSWLGDEHDLTALCARLRQLEQPHGQLLLDPVLRRRAQLRAAVQALGARAFAERPKALRRRAAAWLRAWRGGAGTEAAARRP